MSEPIPADVSAAIAVIQQTRSMTAALAAADRVRLEGAGDVVKRLQETSAHLGVRNPADYTTNMSVAEALEAATLITSLRAENARLRGALNEAVTQIEYLHDKFQVTGSGNTVLARARAALAPKYEDTK